MKIKTRIAPSPTGVAHVGTAYSALFNYAFAKQNGGKFIVRIEDTDQKRNIGGGDQKILDSLKWLGLSWDEPPIYQSKRKDVYLKYADILLKEGKAYREDGGIILKIDNTKDISWKDLIRGKVTFPKSELKDFAIIKKDGFPAYNFAVVVDDHDMQISHVIRAEDHVSNTPRQILAYQNLSFELPEFGHLPLIRNQDKSKMSKRKNPVSIDWYKEEGFLPEAMVNFMCLLGWSHPEGNEKFSLEEFVKLFTIDRVGKSGPVFNIDKLTWLNSEYITNMPDEEFVQRIKDYAINPPDDNTLKKIAPLVKPRLQKLSEFENLAGFIYKDKNPKPPLLTHNKTHISTATTALKNLQGDWTQDKINNALTETINNNNFKTGDFYMDLRGTISGSKVTPPINESIQIMGSSGTVTRLEEGLKEYN